MQIHRLFIAVLISGFLLLPHLSWGQTSSDKLEGKGPPEQLQRSNISWKVLLDKANQMYEIANLDKAMEYAGQLIALESNIPGGWRISGLVNSDRRKFEAAAEDLKKCIALTEKFFGTDVESLQYDYESLGYTLKRLNRLDEAIDAYKKSVTVNPTKGSYIDQLISACQWKYAQKYGKLDGNIFLESDFREDYDLSELAEERLIIREFRHSDDGGRWALEEQKISIKGEKRIDRVTLSCERCNAEKVINFHIHYGPDNTKRLEEITGRYRAAIKDKDANIRIFAASQLKLLEEKYFTAMIEDPDPWVRLSTLRFIEVNKPEMKYIKDFMIDSDPMIKRLAVAVAKRITARD